MGTHLCQEGRWDLQRLARPTTELLGQRHVPERSRDRSVDERI